MDVLLAEYLPILIFLGIAIGLAVVMVVTSIVVARQHPDPEKLSPYECGFEPFDDSRRQFDVRFYLVAILFIIFDLEVAFLFPWAASLGAGRRFLIDDLGVGDVREPGDEREPIRHRVGHLLRQGNSRHKPAPGRE